MLATVPRWIFTAFNHFGVTCNDWKCIIESIYNMMIWQEGILGLSAALSAAAAIIPGRLKQFMLEGAKSLLCVVKGAEGWTGMGCKWQSRTPHLNGNIAVTMNDEAPAPHWDGTWQGWATRGAAINFGPLWLKIGIHRVPMWLLGQSFQPLTTNH